jgi:hypothetical protein
VLPPKEYVSFKLGELGKSIAMNFLSDYFIFIRIMIPDPLLTEINDLVLKPLKRMLCY